MLGHERHQVVRRRCLSFNIVDDAGGGVSGFGGDDTDVFEGDGIAWCIAAERSVNGDS